MHIQKGSIQYCGGCGLPLINCMCDELPKLSSNIEFWIIIHEREIVRPTNTGKLIKTLLAKNATLEIWQRKRASEVIQRKLSSGKYRPYLVFPADSDDFKERVVDYKPRDHRIPAFILLDGTWQEARKIMRQSESLKTLPIIALNPKRKSKFVLRKNQAETHLCTFETAIELMLLAGETKNAKVMDQFFDHYLALFQAGRCGHGLTP